MPNLAKVLKLLCRRFAQSGLCCCGRDQIQENDRSMPKGGTQQSDWQRAVQKIPGAGHRNYSGKDTPTLTVMVMGRRVSR